MSGKLTCTKLTFLTISSLVIQTIGLTLFVSGFFPVNPTLSGVSGPDSFLPPLCNQTPTLTPPPPLKSLYQELSGIPPLYDRLILMVIDGLPAEFVLGKNGQPPRQDFAQSMPYTQSLLANGTAIGFHAKAAPPTVTMPRLKAMVSGAIGGFLDVAFNFNTQAMVDDNLLGQFFKIGWKMVMLGDETWLRLFPGLFMRHDGVSSFYVKDTVQVDHNVSRHLENELSSGDWDLLILHYLGLDHVGHIGGRNSFLVCPKLKEMDEVVKMIHLSTIQNQDNNHGNTLLVVASDHGMTENGNHGGSSYEETDSLALFIGLKNYVSEYASATYNSVHQVDIAPTLAVLFGVPIPKNNVGVLISETFGFLTEDEKLRALELNSWQLLGLVHAQLYGLSCQNFPCDGFTDDLGSKNIECSSSKENLLCCLYMNAAGLHSSWKSNKISGFNSGDAYNNTVAAYYEFLKTASEWLSLRVTDKPVGLVASGIVAMAISSLIFLGLIIYMDSVAFQGGKQHLSSSSSGMTKWRLDETFTIGVVLIVVISMGSSSIVEEEQYIWHFMLATLFLLLLRKTIQSCPQGGIQSKLNCFDVQNKRIYYQFFSVVLLLCSGRILRGWHQGGVNWTHLPDISRWLEQNWGDNVISIQLASGLLVISLGIFALTLLGYRRKIVQVLGFCFLTSGLLVEWHIMELQHDTYLSSSYGATLLAQIIYAVLAVFMVSTVVAVPWIMISSNSSTYNQHNYLSEFGNSSYVIGLAYVLFWCLLQLLLQQPTNSMPIFLLLVQILACMLYYSHSGPIRKEWVEVAAFYYLGMAGHFALGNSNTLATVDVAGAFIGLSSHSMLLSGILMFIITYASPMLFLLSMVMYNFIKDTSYLVTSQHVTLGHLLKMRLGFPCLVPLGLNSILLTAYTIVLLLMRNHLFVWSVFSPKYLYVCATTVCIYVGVFVLSVTEIYTCLVLVMRRKGQAAISNGIR